MTEYTLGVFAILAISGVLSLISYGSGVTEKTAVGIITAYVIISPLLTVIQNLDIDATLDSFTDGKYETDADPSAVAEEAFALGIKQEIADKFKLDKDNIRVKIIDFNMEKMCSGQIKIFLRGKAALADYRGIEEYVNRLGMGDCRVEIELGKGTS